MRYIELYSICDSVPFNTRMRGWGGWPGSQSGLVNVMLGGNDHTNRRQTGSRRVLITLRLAEWGGKCKAALVGLNGWAAEC